MSALMWINVIGFAVLTLILVLAGIGGALGWWWGRSPPSNGMHDLATLYGYESNQAIPGRETT